MSAPVRFELEPILARLQQQSYELLAALPLFVLALAILWLAWLFGRWLSQRGVLQRVARKNPFLQSLLRTTVQWIVTGAGVLVALDLLDATALVGAVLGTAGVLGVALGFAFKDILENYLAGILLSVRQPFAKGDHLVIEGNEGIVVALTSRATILMTPDGNHLRLPNALVFRGVTLNYTRNPSRRFQFDVGIGVNEDLVAARALGLEALAGIEGMLATPPPRAHIASLGDSSVQLRFHGWVDQRAHDFLMVRSEAIRAVKLALDAGGMDMPEPIYRVQLHQASGPAIAPAHRGPSARPAGVAAVDTRATTDLDQQIEKDPGVGDEDLLDPTAKRE
ncbi:mechanosensitive ion channel family protein [Arenimonas alkanexedens]